MRCTRCNEEKYPLTYIPTPVSTVARKVRYGEWVCPGCLTDEEAGGPKARLLKVLRAGLTKPPTLKTIPREEYLYALKAASFRCPKGRRPENCDGHPCPRRPEGMRLSSTFPFNLAKIMVPTSDYYNECVSSLQAHMLVMEVLEGRVQLDQGLNSWEAPLP